MCLSGFVSEEGQTFMIIVGDIFREVNSVIFSGRNSIKNALLFRVILAHHPELEII